MDSGRDSSRKRSSKTRLGRVAMSLFYSILLLSSCTTSSSVPLSPCPPDMVFISGGAYLTGASSAELQLSPLAEILGFGPRPPQFAETGDFCMDPYEYPNQPGVLPRAQITYTSAWESCRSRQKRLCTETEFERACGGLDGWHQPYGPYYVPGYCNNDVIKRVGDTDWLAPSGAFGDCVSPEGVYDLEGNLSEYVAPAFPEPMGSPDIPLEIDSTATQVESAAANDDKTVRGGTMWWAIYGAGCHARHSHPDPGPAHDDDGFRCCADTY